ncbi:hypothetical protein OEZ85_011443 [Tetradesmus obliquus]|uniref:Pherophorin domain-containing protein n=1 Tax=Tetradesmus obliquus TaxID=3088 RepID=A0ABY8TQC7_TETOB|nr:hypothetical protein OEZ85_011443 [Tetradesmus obliquus]
MASGQWQGMPLLLVIAVLLLWQHPMAVQAACCTQGQPSYIGAGFVPASYGYTYKTLTCSDGPCVGANFNYLTAGFGVSQSADPDACCSTDTNPNNGYWYNPPAGSGQTWWRTETAYGGPYPGTGRTCNPSVAKHTCSSSQAVPRCVDTRPDLPDAQPWYCDAAQGLFVNQSAWNAPSPSNTVCCLRATCGDRDVFRPNAQPHRCPMGSELDPGATDASPPTNRRCCRPVPTCGDWNLQQRNAQPWICDLARGLAQNPNATMYPNPSDAMAPPPSPSPSSSQTPTSSPIIPSPSPTPTQPSPSPAATASPSPAATASPSPATAPSPSPSPAATPGVASPSPSLAPASSPSPSPSVVVPPPSPAPTGPFPTGATCGDVNPALGDFQPFPCPAGTLNNPARFARTNPTTRRCCMATCSDYNVNLDNQQAWPCPEGTVPNPANALWNPPNNGMCCLGTCSDRLPGVDGKQPWRCPANTLVNASAALKSPASDTDCCLNLPPAASPSPAATPQAASPSPAVTPPAASPSPAVTPSPSPAETATCGDTNLNLDGQQPYPCPEGLVNNPASFLVNPPNADDKCVA